MNEQLIYIYPTVGKLKNGRRVRYQLDKQRQSATVITNQAHYEINPSGIPIEKSKALDSIEAYQLLKYVELLSEFDTDTPDKNIIVECENYVLSSLPTAEVLTPHKI